MTHERLTRLREPLVGRTVYRARSRQGMDVRVAPMPGFVHTAAVLGVRFGALDTRLAAGRPLPLGTAHFLEHVMFQKEDGDVFAVYDARGAAGNAFTTWTWTGFVFTCSEDAEANLDTLLGAVRRLEVDAAGVDRERRIIGREIATYADDPAWRGYAALLGAMYRRHPVREDIAGTPASIAAIDAALLAEVHRRRYHPHNLVLAVAGPLAAGRVLARADALGRPGGRGGRNRRSLHPEPPALRRREVRETLPIARPHAWLGVKDEPPGGGRALVGRQVLTGLVLEALFEDGGRIQSALYDDGLVDDTFQAAFECEADVAHLVISAEVDDVGRYRTLLRRHIEEAAASGLTAEDLERARRRMVGRRLRLLDAPESFAHWLAACVLEGVGLDAATRALEAATVRTANRRLRRLAARPQAWAILEPAER